MPVLNFSESKWVGIALILCFCVVWFGRVRYTNADPMGSLMVSDALLTRRTIKLDRFGEEALEKYGFRIHKKNDHFYYYFPLGTPILSLPLVIMAKAIGLDPKSTDDALQIVACSLTGVLTLWFLFKLALFFLPPNQATLVASAFWFGSSWASTGGAALWSHNWASLCALMAIYFSIRSARSGNFKIWPMISLLLFLSYLCRPTLSLLSPFLIFFIFSHEPKTGFKTGVLFLGLLALFVLFSMSEFNQLLPDYYWPKRLSGGDFWTAIYGNLLSPARGLLIYSPFLVTSWFCFSRRKKEFLKKAWLGIAAGWPLFHLVLISRFPHWWGGFSFGPRLMTDVLPGLYLLTLYSWPTRFNCFSGLKGASHSFLIASIVFSVFVNTGQGLFNDSTFKWNWQPNIDQKPELIFDWKYPQFLASKKMLEKRMSEFADSN
ncbi:MAG: glycosyltransferase family 39 protein [Pseudomonadota bacterium]